MQTNYQDSPLAVERLTDGHGAQKHNHFKEDRNMLVLRRRMNERILIGDNIEIVIVAIDNQGVKLGIEAPSEVQIARDDAIVKVKHHPGEVTSYTSEVPAAAQNGR